MSDTSEALEKTMDLNACERVVLEAAFSAASALERQARAGLEKALHEVVENAKARGKVIPDERDDVTIRRSDQGAISTLAWRSKPATPVAEPVVTAEPVAA